MTDRAAGGVTADPQRGPPASADPGTGPGLPAPFPRSWFEREPVDLAKALLGALMVRADGVGVRIARIVETEAYDGTHDRASHARAGRTQRTEPMFGPAGRLYVYLVYGMHHCMNVVARTDGVPGAVLVRALEPVGGMAAMRHVRGDLAPARVPDSRLLAGPALACAGMSVDRRMSGHDLTVGRELWIAGDPDAGAAPVPLRGPRVGVDYAGPDWATLPWRFGVPGSPALSRPFPTPQEP